MNRYTLDASGLLRYFVDALPGGAARAVDEALNGDAVLEVPAIAAAEAAYVAHNRDAIAGHALRASPEDVVTLLRSDGPFVSTPTDLEVLAAALDWQDEFPRQLHDALIVASHEASGTDAVITSDDRIDDCVPTIWQ